MIQITNHSLLIEIPTTTPLIDLHYLHVHLSDVLFKLINSEEEDELSFKNELNVLQKLLRHLNFSEYQMSAITEALNDNTTLKTQFIHSPL